MNYKIINYIILISAVIILGYLVYNITRHNENVLRFYTYTWKQESFNIVYYFLYALGSILNLKKPASGSGILLFGMSGFIVAAIGDLGFIHSYPIWIYLVHIILHSVILLVAKKPPVWIKLMIFAVINAGVIYFLYSQVNIRLML